MSQQKLSAFGPSHTRSLRYSDTRRDTVSSSDIGEFFDLANLKGKLRRPARGAPRGVDESTFRYPRESEVCPRSSISSPRSLAPLELDRPPDSDSLRRDENLPRSRFSSLLVLRKARHLSPRRTASHYPNTAGRYATSPRRMKR